MPSDEWAAFIIRTRRVRREGVEGDSSLSDNSVLAKYFSEVLTYWKICAKIHIGLLLCANYKVWQCGKEQPMAKMRASMHNGKRSQKTNKVIKPPHNDTDRESNPNVYDDWVENNLYWNCYDGGYTESDKYERDANGDFVLDDKGGKKFTEKMKFQDVELKYYNENYASALDEQNAKYKKNRQHKHVKTMEDWLGSPMYAPTETILRVGNVDDGFASVSELKAMLDEYLSDLNDWSKRHGNCYHILNWSLHGDEFYEDDVTKEVKLSSPHVHIRGVYDYVDENGIRKIGIEKALEQAGIEPPTPYANTKAKKPTRYNNRKMTFDAQCRELWQDKVKNHGFDIETTPRPNKRRAKDREGYILDKRADKAILQASEREAAANEAIRQAQEREAEAAKIIQDAEKLKKQAINEGRLEADKKLEERKKRLEDREKRVNELNEKSEREQQALKTKHNKLDAAIFEAETLISDTETLISEVKSVKERERLNKELAQKQYQKFAKINALTSDISTQAQDEHDGFE
jgi:hypothetical protein